MRAAATRASAGASRHASMGSRAPARAHHTLASSDSCAAIPLRLAGLVLGGRGAGPLNPRARPERGRFHRRSSLPEPEERLLGEVAQIPRLVAQALDQERERFGIAPLLETAHIFALGGEPARVGGIEGLRWRE